MIRLQKNKKHFPILGQKGGTLIGTLDEKSRQLLKETSEKYGYSARVIHKLLRMARTSADLAEVENIRMEDVKRILNYRDLDRNNSKMLVVN